MVCLLIEGFVVEGEKTDRCCRFVVRLVIVKLAGDRFLIKKAEEDDGDRGRIGSGEKEFDSFVFGITFVDSDFGFNLAGWENKGGVL
jgi:hypothetical protein